MERPMSHFTTGRSFDHILSRTNAGSAAVDSISNFIGRTIDRMARHMQRERTRRELLDLDDHMLEDIGLSRMDLRGGRFAELNRINWSGRGHPSGM
jgi:uncharacterized protein YjiS (DUF1127 family)